MEEEIEDEIHKLFFDSSNRPKKTPKHESSIQILLENKFSSGQIKGSLSRLEESGVLKTEKYQIEGLGTAKFYFPSNLPIDYIKKQIPIKIAKASYWISRYSDLKTTRMLGEHLHYLVKSELRVHGFEILEEKQVRRYREREWVRSRHTLDIIAENKIKEIAIGVEVKNMLTPTPKSEIITKIEMCKTLGIYPIFACRWQEMHREEIEKGEGFLWQFKDQLYPFGQENLVMELRKRFNFPVEVKGELPKKAIKDFENYLNKFN